MPCDLLPHGKPHVRDSVTNSPQCLPASVLIFGMADSFSYILSSQPQKDLLTKLIEINQPHQPQVLWRIAQPYACIISHSPLTIM